MTDTLEIAGAHDAALRALLRGEAPIPAPEWLARDAALQDDEAERARAAADPEGFWAERAEGVEWFRRWDRVMRFEPPHHAWFEGGKLNATVSCIDRHVYGLEVMHALQKNLLEQHAAGHRVVLFI